MRGLLMIALAGIVGTAFAQGVLERLEGEFNVVGTATNANGAVFYELDAVPPNIQQALSDGVVEEESQQVALITPTSLVYYATVINGRVYSYRTGWNEFVQLNSPSFKMESLVIEVAGNYLNDEALASARNATLSRRASSRSSNPRNGCVSTTTSSRSSTTCYRDGRVVSRIVCTTNSITYATTCRSDYY